VLSFVTHCVKHVVAGLDEEPHDHQHGRALHHNVVSRKLEMGHLVIVMRYTQVHRNEFPKECERWNKKYPHEYKVPVKYVKERVQAVRLGQFLEVRADAKL
jgi:hypothetical protein